MNRNTQCMIGVALAGAVGLLLSGDIVEEMRLHRVAQTLESSKAVKNKYGSGCSVTTLDHGKQSAIVFAGAYHISRFRICGDGVNKTIWVKCAGSTREWGARGG